MALFDRRCEMLSIDFEGDTRFRVWIMTNVFHVYQGLKDWCDPELIISLHTTPHPLP